MKFRFLMENKTEGPGCIGEHGLSVYIEAQGKKLLFDTGASSLLKRNAEALGTDLRQVETVVISHGHYDHTGGVPEFCRINRTAPIYIHKEAFHEAYAVREGQMEERTCGIRWTQEEKELIESRMILTQDSVWLSDNIVISGTIPKIEGYAPAELFYRKMEDGSLQPDPMEHEQFLAIREPEGLYVFSGCSHRGVVPAVRRARELFSGERIAVLTAGMHLYSADKEMRSKVISQVLSEEMDLVIPVHCTGLEAICELKTALGDKCFAATAGSSYGY